MSTSCACQLACLLLWGLWASACHSGGSQSAVPTPRVELLVSSDPHYYDPSLGTTGTAFDSYVAHDRRLIAESDAIMRALVSAEVMPADVPGEVQTLRAAPDLPTQLAATMLASIWTDLPPPDNNVSLDLATR